MKKIIAVKTEVYSRIVGYFRPVEGWNVGKKEEFKDRNYLKIEEKKYGRLKDGKTNLP
ncbi:MAG: anaerobic ribonucleoside-triphosphate reductase [candidate division WOR-3 bacterium]